MEIVISFIVGIVFLVCVISIITNLNPKNSEASSLIDSQGRKVVKIKEKDIYRIILIFIVPLLITLALEHTQKVNVTQRQGFQGVYGVNLETVFGNTVIDNDREKLSKCKFSFYEDVPYSFKFTYYFKGLVADIIYPLITSFVIFLIFLLTKRYRFNIQ